MPGPGLEVCPVCSGPKRGGAATCPGCAAVGAALGRPLAPVLPVSVCGIPGPLYHALRGYKSAPVAEARRRFGAIVGEVLAAFYDRHLACLERLAGGRFDAVLAVPPTARPGPAPIQGVLRVPLRPDLLVRGPGPMGHRRPSIDGYRVPDRARSDVAGRRILLVEDLYTTGARAQSAAAAMGEGGAAAVVILAVGRAVRPAGARSHRLYWLAGEGRPFDPARCCAPRCGQPRDR